MVINRPAGLEKTKLIQSLPWAKSNGPISNYPGDDFAGRIVFSYIGQKGPMKDFMAFFEKSLIWYWPWIENIVNYSVYIFISIEKIRNKWPFRCFIMNRFYLREIVKCLNRRAIKDWAKESRLPLPARSSVNAPAAGIWWAVKMQNAEDASAARIL